MDLRLLVDVTTILGSLALVTSVIFLFRELRETNRLTRASNTQTLVSLSSPFHLGLIQDRKMAEFFVLGPQHFLEMDEIDKYRYRSLLTWWLIFHENVFYQWRQGLLDRYTFKAWDEDLKGFIQQQNLAMLWGTMRHLFQNEFATHVDQIIREYQGPSIPGGQESQNLRGSVESSRTQQV